MPPISFTDTAKFDARSYSEVILPKTHQAPNAFEERDHASIQTLFVTDPADDMQMIANKKDKLLNTTDN